MLLRILVSLLLPEGSWTETAEALLSWDLAGSKLGSLPAGQYRLFVTVKDGRGAAATANLPFLVN